MTFNVPEIIPSEIQGADFFNFFFALPLIVLVVVIVPLVCIMLIMRS